jgi:CheY-like chemotaxis protein
MSLLDEMKAVKVNVLIVEDNLINQTVLKRQLQKCGWEVSVAGNGQEALDWLRASVYWRGEREADKEHDTIDDMHEAPPTEPLKELDIILLDVEMPIM